MKQKFNVCKDIFLKSKWHFIRYNTHPTILYLNYANLHNDFNCNSHFYAEMDFFRLQFASVNQIFFLYLWNWVNMFYFSSFFFVYEYIYNYGAYDSRFVKIKCIEHLKNPA